MTIPIIEQIEVQIKRLDEADLPAATYRTARRLLDRADAQGVTCVSRQEMGQISGCTHPGALRRQLREIELACGAEAQTSGHMIVIAWCGEWGNALVERAAIEPNALSERENALNERADAPNERANALVERAAIEPNALSERENALNERENALSERAALIRVRARALGRQVGRSDLIQERDLPACPPTPQPPSQLGGAAEVTLPPPTPATPPTPAEQNLSVALLIAAGMSAGRSEALARLHPFSLVRQAVARWWYGRKSQGGKYSEEPGIVVTWLTHLDDYPIANYRLPDSWYYTPLGKFQTPSERKTRPQAAVRPHQGETLEEAARRAAYTEFLYTESLCLEGPDSELESPLPLRNAEAMGENGANASGLDVAWERLMTELAPAMPSLYRCLEGSRIVSADPDADSPQARIIVAQRRGLDYAQRARPLLTTRLRGILDQPVTLEVTGEVAGDDTPLGHMAGSK